METRRFLLVSLHPCYHRVCFFPLHLLKLLAFSSFLIAVSVQTLMHRPLNTWGHWRLSTGWKASRWADCSTVPWLRPEPQRLSSPAAGGRLQGGASQAIPSWSRWRGGSHIGEAPSLVDSQDDRAGVGVCVVLLLLTRRTPFHRAFLASLPADCLQTQLGDSASAWLPRGR